MIVLDDFPPLLTVYNRQDQQDIDLVWRYPKPRNRNERRRGPSIKNVLDQILMRLSARNDT